MAYCIYYQAENIWSELRKCLEYPRRMEYTMLSLKSILIDAEEKQEHNRYLYNWLKEVQKLFSQIEGSIDEVKEEAYKQEGSGKQVLAPFLCANQIVHIHKMEKLLDHLDAVASKMYQFNLEERHTDSIKMETTKSFLSATEVLTRLLKPSWKFLYPLTYPPKDYNKDRSNKFLKDFKDSTHRFFHIVGKAGIGKTTLAKFFYNDPAVQKMFPSRLWVCVKEEFDTQRLIKEILSLSYYPETCDNQTERQLCSVEQHLSEKTLLLVFQDLSIKNLDNRSMFKRLVWMGNRGSKIIVTTQDEKIADAIGLKVYEAEKQSQQNLEPIQSQRVQVPVTKEPSNVNNNEKSIQDNPPGEKEKFKTHQTIFKVEKLSDSNSSSLFQDYPFSDTQKKDSNLTKIEDGIVKKCGVPLAIKCLGRLLSSGTSIAELTDSNWMALIENQLKREKVAPINKQQAREEETEEDSTLLVLKFCYDQMPSHLKLCFLSCCQLPNDSVLSSNDVIQFWMAHGHLELQSSQDNYLSLEKRGEKYFKELCSRCFLQEIGENGLGYWFEMHPLIRKLAHELTREQDKRSIPIKPVTEIKSIAFRVRDEVPPSAFLVDKCISTFQCLRLLYLGHTDLQKIPNAIGTLKYLRYLDLQESKRIKRLPNSICNLQNLQTLILASCSALQKLPRGIRKLINLRYLWVSANRLQLLKNGVGTMTSLRFLAIGGCDNLQDLFERPSRLERLETLVIYDCNTLQSLPNEMGSLLSLQNLVMWGCKELKLNLEKVEFSLQRFTIRDLPKVHELPEWLHRSTETLRVLEIIDCPMKLEKEKYKTYKAIESIIIQGAVRVGLGTEEHADNRSNWVWRRRNVKKEGDIL